MFKMLYAIDFLPGDRTAVCKQCIPARNWVMPHPKQWRKGLDGKWRNDTLSPFTPGSTTIDRDINAARNIKYLGICKVNDYPGDVAFRRDNQPQQQQQQPI